jgi:hypothetical protein
MMNEPKPFAWVLPGDDTARDDGFIDAMVIQQGEFSKPLSKWAKNGGLNEELFYNPLTGPDQLKGADLFRARAALTQQGDRGE